MRIHHDENTRSAIVQALEYLLSHENALESVPSKEIMKSIQYYQSNAVLDTPSDCKLRRRNDVYHVLKQYGLEDRTDDTLLFLERLPDRVATLAASNALRDAAEKIPYHNAGPWLTDRAYLIQGEHYV